MSLKKVGWCRLTDEIVLDKCIVNQPYVRDDMDVYSWNGAMWLHWTPETQGYSYVKDADIPDVVKMAMVILE